ncbi:MAG: glycosyltransferase family 2 protein [Chloroflexota bacterium]
MSDILLSIIIVNWNTRALLAECLQSLADTLPGVAHDIWVVDNASGDDSLAMLARDFPAVQVIANRENVGFGRANNQAMARSRGRFMLLFNSDAVATPGSIDALLQLAQSQERAGMVGAHLRNTDGSFQASYTPFPTLWQEFLILSGLGRALYGRHYPSRGPAEERGPQAVDYVEGACMLVRRETFEQVGGFDENFFMYAEEVDWCCSMKEAGWQVWYHPEARIIHHGSGSSNERRTKREGDLYQSRVRFFRKHYGNTPAAALKVLIYLFTALKGGAHGFVRLISGGKRGRAVISLKELSEKLAGV